MPLSMDTRFHCVYLLTSLDPQCEGDFYIGYTVNPLRRLRQHNGELVNGARQTSRRGRPWTIVCCVSGFTEDRAALKFEWCWQNPTVSARLKHTVGALKGLRRLPYAVGTLHLLIRAPLFNQLDLTLHIFEPDVLQAAKAKAEIFLATRAGPRGSPSVSPSSPSSPPPRLPVSSGDAFPAARVQVLNVSSAYSPAGATAASSASGTVSPPQLPPLAPSALFHVEVTTRQAFEDAYLSHDRCLLLPSVGATGVAENGGGDSPARVNDRNKAYSSSSGAGDGDGGARRLGATGAMGRDGEGEDSCWGASCPYDVVALSQAARAEWSNASCEESVAVEAHGREWEAEARSRTPSPSLVDRSPAQPLPLLGYHSEERPEDGVAESEGNVYSVESPSISPLRVRPVSPSHSPVPAMSAENALPGTQSIHRTVDGEASLDRSLSPTSANANSFGFASTTAAAAPAGPQSDDTRRTPSPPRIPLRFACYAEADFAHAHAAEQYRLHHGLLPCSLCTLPLRSPCVVHCSRAPFCELRCHLSCLAMWMLYAEHAASHQGGVDGSAISVSTEGSGPEVPHLGLQGVSQQHPQAPVPSQAVAAGAAVSTSACAAGEEEASTTAAYTHLIPSQPCPCPLCGVSLQWGALVKSLKKRAVVEARLLAAQRRAKIEQRWQTRLAQINSHARGKERRGYGQRKRPRTKGAAATDSSVTTASPRGVSPASCADTPASPLSRLCDASCDGASAAPSASTSSSSRPKQGGHASSARSAAPDDASGLSWTAFCEDDWLL